jgi:hypothetical protein
MSTSDETLSEGAGMSPCSNRCCVDRGRVAGAETVVVDFYEVPRRLARKRHDVFAARAMEIFQKSKKYTYVACWVGIPFNRSVRDVSRTFVDETLS